MQGPNHIWHADGYDKLKPYGFPVHGCIEKHLQCEKLLGLAGGNQKAWKQEIRREHNSNPLQRNDTLSQLTVNFQFPGPSIYQLPCHHHTLMNCMCNYALY